MAEKPELHILRKGDFAAGRIPPWRDPHGVLAVRPWLRRYWLGNPLSGGDDDPIRAVATIGDSVAGRVNLVISELRVRGESIRVLWGFDLIVSTDFRGGGLGTKVVGAWRDAWHTVVGNAVNRISEPIYPKLGWAMHYTPARQLVMHSRRFLEPFLRLPPAAAAAGAVVDAGLAAWRRLGGFASPGRLHGLRAEPVRSLSADLDPLLARQEAPIEAHRSAAWVNWLLACPEPEEREEYRLYLARDRDDQVAGYFILRRHPPLMLQDRFRDVVVGSVKEWRVLDPERADPLALVLLALGELAAWGADVLMIVLPGLPAQGLKVLARLGFREREPLRASFFAHPTSPMAAEEYRRGENWRHAWANSDGLFF